MVSQLQSEIPAVDGAPTTAQYNQAVKDAVMDFSRRCGLVKIASLAIVSGTATYALATDFLKLISMDALVGMDGVIVSNNGLIPLSKDFEEEWTIVNKQVTFYPTPAYSMTRYYKYKAAWVAVSDDYTTLGDDEVQIVLLRAKSIASGKIANAQAGDSIKYTFGAVSEDLSDSSDATRNEAQSFDTDFEEACEVYNGQYAAYG